MYERYPSRPPPERTPGFFEILGSLLKFTVGFLFLAVLAYFGLDFYQSGKLTGVLKKPSGAGRSDHGRAFAPSLAP